ncbi:MAG TPA: Ig-like domain-containing protein [Bacilli bacterium]|nr:Ig-like domain-containing protein [Bacilli bacterium]HQA56066.1 Ig-like domain-containing protein [Bacilli bacterium]
MKTKLLALIIFGFVSLTACDLPIQPNGIKVMSVDISETEISLAVSHTRTLTATVSPTKAAIKTVNWTIEDSDIATINSSGLVTGIAEGETTVTVTTVDGGHTDTCEVVVTAASVEELWDESQDHLRTGTKTIDFYSLNDFHGSTENISANYEPGINKLSTFFKNEKAKNPGGFVLTASGDMWQGSADSNLTNGRLVNDWMGLIGFSAMAIGNHEFDWTVDTIKENMENMNFPLLACNIIDTTTNQPVDWVEPYTTITKNGVRIGIVGAIGQGLTTSILAPNVAGLSFANPNQYVIDWADYLRSEGADIILYLLHNSVSTIPENTGNAVDAIFGGHTHRGENNLDGDPTTTYSTPAVQAWSNGQDVGHIQLTYNFSTEAVANQTAEIIDTRSFVIDDLTDDTETATLYQSYLDNEISAIKNRVLLEDSDGFSRDELGLIYNQYAYRYYKEEHDTDDYDVMGIVSGSSRDDVPSGPVTYGMIYKALPFDNALVVVKIIGSEVVNKLKNQGTFYLGDSNKIVEGDSIGNYVLSDNYYYFLMQDFSAYRSPIVEVVEIIDIFAEEDALPRNIVSRYLPNYPDNVIFNKD